jgi:hypothetical protein
MTISNDSLIYKNVIDSLVQIALRAKQLHPIVIISESKRLRKPKGPNDESLTDIIHSYAKDSIDYLHNAANYKVLENKQLRKVLLSVGQFTRCTIPLPISETPAQIRYKSNGWTVFKSYEKIEQYRKKNPDFFCVADVTKPIYSGDYALVVIDRQFNPLGGGGYIHIFKRSEGEWQTYVITNLWHY